MVMCLQTYVVFLDTGSSWDADWQTSLSEVDPGCAAYCSNCGAERPTTTATSAAGETETMPSNTTKDKTFLEHISISLRFLAAPVKSVIRKVHIGAPQVGPLTSLPTPIGQLDRLRITFVAHDLPHLLLVIELGDGINCQLQVAAATFDGDAAVGQ